MPARNPPPPVDPTLCIRCATRAPQITIRKDPLCSPCFAKYAQTKVVKRLETFRVRNSTSANSPTLLLPLSFGPCSTALLHILSQHRKVQAEKTRRSGYGLHVVHVRGAGEEGEEGDDAEERLERVRQRYPEHTYTLLSLSSILEHPELLPSNLPSPPSAAPDASQPTKDARLTALLTSLPSPTAVADLIVHLLRKSLLHHAALHNFTSILYAHSTTRLASLTLSETAKGRGFSVPASTVDASAPFAIPFYFPLRDLLTSEIHSYLRFLDPPVSDLVRWPQEGKGKGVSARSGTIDALVAGYFEGVEGEYPSIVANVVRTVGKLDLPDLEVGVGEERCELCDMGLRGRAPERSRLCWGCVRTLPGGVA